MAVEIDISVSPINRDLQCGGTAERHRDRPCQTVRLYRYLALAASRWNRTIPVPLQTQPFQTEHHSRTTTVYASKYSCSGISRLLHLGTQSQ
jgi:hypothetical protein